MADDYWIADPIDGQIKSFKSTYGDPKRYIFKIVAYNGPIPKEPEDNYQALAEKNRKLCEQLSEKIREVGDLEVKIAEYKAADEKQEKELHDAHGDVRDLLLKVESQQTTINKQEKETKKLKDDMDVLVTDNTQLKSDYSALQARKVEDYSAMELFKVGLEKLFGRK